MLQVGDYSNTSAPYGVTVTIGSHTFRTDPLNVNFIVEICNDYYSDNYVFHSYNNVGSDGVTVHAISFQLDDFSQTAVNDTALTASALDLTKWQQLLGLM